MGLFTKDEMSKINRAAKKSNIDLAVKSKPKRSRKGAKAEIDEMSRKVEEYFADSDAILITTVEELHGYVTKCLEAGYCGIDTETTGLDRINDHVVGFSLYYPGGHECYVPNKHLIYIFDEPCSGQLAYEQCKPELQRLVDGKCKMIFANADYDIAMIYHDFGVDFCSAFYYDVILAWRILKENEPRNGLKELYCKYVLKGNADPMKFSDFFSVDLFPYCKPQVAKLYAAHDAKITYDLFRWQLPYTIKTNPKCKKNHLERIADIIWNIEFPMVKVCALMHRNGIYFDPYVAEKVQVRYHEKYNKELSDLQQMVDDLVKDLDTPNNRKRPFKTGYDFVPTSPKHVQYLCYDLLKLPDPGGKGSTDKGILRDFGLPQTDKILSVRSLSTLINSFVDKLIRVSHEADGRIHPQFLSTGADTGRMSSRDPNAQNIPSHATDIRHMFRATPEIDEVVTSEDGTFTFKYYDRIPTSDGYVPVGNWGYQTIFVTRDGQEVEEHCSVSSDSSSTCTVEVNGGGCSIAVQHPEYIMFSSDYSQQEPRIAAAVAHDQKLIQSFRDGKDVYATIASVAFNKPYEYCLEFHPETHEYQPEGKELRTQAKSIVLGILYGRSTVTIGEQLFGRNKDMTDEDKTKAAQHVYDSVLNAFPDLRQAMYNAQESARVRGYTETIFGRRRHIPDMQLPRFEFKAMPGYVNPDVDPLDVSTLQNQSDIPDRIVNQLKEEFSKYKYYGQIVRRTKELRAEHIRVINNTRKITDATRQCLNGVIQGSAADMTKIALLNLQYNDRWNQIGGRVLTPVHDEIICEVPIDFYKEGSEILKNCMEDAGDFLPFHIYCDVETTLRWYGLEYPCPYKKPQSFSFDLLKDMTEDEISWIQYHLFESEYQLPKFPDKDGNAPIGNAAKGINGQISDDMISYIKDYMNIYNVSEESFLNHIERKVQKGIVDHEV